MKSAAKRADEDRRLAAEEAVREAFEAWQADGD
jgi:hypothetical protein